MKSVKQLFYLEDGKKRGPIKIEDINKFNIHQNTLVWFEGLDGWMRISEIKDNFDLKLSIPPEIPSKSKAIEHNVKRSIANLSIKFFKLLGVFLTIGLILFISSYFYISNNPNLDYGISRYEKTLNNHSKEFNHNKDRYCQFSYIPEYINKSNLLRNVSDEEFFLASKEQIIKEITYYYKLECPECKVDEIDTEDLNALYKSIRCVYHNRAMSLYTERARINIRDDAFLFTIASIVFLLLFFLIFKFVRFVLRNKK